jgi:hypothetical protein
MPRRLYDENNPPPECPFDGCTRLVKVKGLCAGHYQQQWEGRPLTPLGSAPARKPCPGPECKETVVRASYCPGHAQQVKNGVALGPLNRAKKPCRFETCDRLAPAMRGATHGLCPAHYAQMRRGKPLKPFRPKGRTARYVSRDGYVVVPAPVGHANARPDGRILEHQLVMSEHLGRPLLKGENVHHRNGDRADNRIENLELWSTRQPKGQRVADKVAWARLILAQYEAELERFPVELGADGS